MTGVQVSSDAGSIEGFELLDVVLLSQVLRNRLVVIGGVVDRGVEPVVMGNPLPGGPTPQHKIVSKCPTMEIGRH